jgi:histidine ammonia-lyase
VTVVLTGNDLRLGEVVRVARAREDAALAPEAIERMRAARAVVDEALEGDVLVYGLTTGVGAQKRVRVPAAESEEFNRLLILNHRVGTGADAPPDVARATLLRLANGFAKGTAGVRVELAERLLEALADPPRVRTLGSVGQADLAPLADLAHGILGDVALAPKEGIALLNNNAFSTAWAALAVADTERLLDAMDVAAALDLEAFGANLSPLHPAVAAARPYAGLRLTRARLESLLDGSALWDEGAARNLQDPLTFRNVVHVHGAARDALAYATGQLEIELNASQDNPLVVVEEERIVSTGNFDVLPLAAALDLLRIALAPVVTAACERVVKLLQSPFTGLPEGLAARAGLPHDSLIEYGVAAQALASEARLLTQPVSYEVVSTTQQEGIEDRATMAPLGARRLAEMIDLAERLVTIELLVAAQAVDLRGRPRLGAGTRRAFDRVRERAAFTGEREPIPDDLEPLREVVRSGELGRG